MRDKLKQKELNYTYILECKDGIFYTGWINDLEKRLKNHNDGKGAKYTKAWLPVSLVYYEGLVLKKLNRIIFFYTRYSEEKHRNDIEIDFLLSNESKTNFRVFPIEVKSSKNYTTTSLGRFKEMFGKKIASQYIIHPKNLIVEGDIIKIPPYMFGVAFK